MAKCITSEFDNNHLRLVDTVGDASFTESVGRLGEYSAQEMRFCRGEAGVSNLFPQFNGNEVVLSGNVTRGGHETEPRQCAK